MTMRKMLLTLGLGLAFATPALAANDGVKPVQTKKAHVHKIAEGDKPAEGAKAEPAKKTTKKTTKKMDKKGEEKPAEAAPAK
jgi:hypothetical protein